MSLHRSSHKRTISAPASSKLLSSKPPLSIEIPQLEQSEAYGSFIPTRSASPSLKYFAFPGITDIEYFENDDTPPPSPSFSHLWTRWPRARVPSISRTLSSDSETSSPIISSPLSLSVSISDDRLLKPYKPLTRKLKRKNSGGTGRYTEPLAGLGLFTRTVDKCATCGKHGSCFPRCPRCGDMWCSRACRLVGGKKHVCSAFRVCQTPGVDEDS